MNAHTNVDLHVHTVESDGTDTLKERVQQAQRRDLEAIAITDHDRISDQLEAGSQQYGDLEVVTGVEIRADLLDTKIELLGYFVDPSDQTLNSVLERARTYRRDRNRKLVHQLNNTTGLNLDYEELTTEVRGEIGRPHLANILLKEGYVDTINEAFINYLAEEGRCFVPMERIQYDKVINAIQSAGGVASLAHPGRIRSERVPELIESTVSGRLDAIEMWYPYDGDPDFGVEEVNQFAEERDLLRTGGSDCHGRDSGKFRIGTTGTTLGALESMRPECSEVGQ